MFTDILKQSSLGIFGKDISVLALFLLIPLPSFIGGGGGGCGGGERFLIIKGGGGGAKDFIVKMANWEVIYIGGLSIDSLSIDFSFNFF